MKKIFKLFIFILIIIFILFNSTEIINSIKLSFSICINNLFPSLIPFMLISNILINYNFIDDLSELFKNIMNKIFNVNKSCAFVFIMSMVSGTPSNAKYINDLYSNKLIDINDVTKCLKFCHFTNPIFILGTIGPIYLKNKKLGLIILIAHYLSSITIGIIFRNNKKRYNNNITHSNNINKKNFFTTLTSSINSTINTLLLILGIITTCLVITCLLNKVFNINNNYKFIYGLLEITQGLNYLHLSNISDNLKTIIASFLVSFGGICIHLQVFSILDNKKIRYLPYLISRILSGFLSSTISFILIKLFL